MVNLSLDELKLIAKFRGIKGYKSMPEDKLLIALNASSVKTIREIRKENLEKGKILRDLDSFFDPEKYHYEPKKTVSAFNNNYIDYESMGDKDKNLSIKEYLDMIRPYLSDIINDHKTQGEWRIHSGNTIIKHKTQSEWKIQVRMAIDFISSKPDSDETPSTMHTKINNIEIMMGSETDEIIEELFKSLLQKYQEVLEKSTKGGEFIFDNVDVLYYNLNKINLNRGTSYIDFLEWLKNKKATINPKNNDGQYFQYVVTVALNHEQIKNHPEISKIMPFIHQCNWKVIDFLSHKKDWKKFESNTE